MLARLLHRAADRGEGAAPGASASRVTMAVDAAFPSARILTVAMRAECSRLPGRPAPIPRSPLAVVAVAPGRCVHRRTDRHPNARQDPGTLARGKARRQESVIDFPSYCEAVEHRRREEQPLIVREAVRRGVDIALRGGDDTLVI